jgi:hypothetical protein
VASFVSIRAHRGIVEKLARPASRDYFLSMSTATIAKRFHEALALRPLKGHPNVSVISAKPLDSRAKLAAREGRGRQISGEDWDKFEKDIADAFERDP